MRILLVRHPAPAIAPGVCYGRLDIGLAVSPDALVTGLRGYGIARVHTSPARRCRVVAEALTATPVIDDRLQELDFGEWEGRLWDMVDRAGLDAWAGDLLGFAPPGGESGASLVARVTDFVGDLRDRGDDAIVITHGGPLRLLPALLRGDPPDLLAAAPGFGAILDVHQASAVSTTPSTTTAQPPRTSPVKPPI